MDLKCIVSGCKNAEPQIQYHFDTGGKLRTSWTERPLDLAVPVGIRISW